MARNLNSFKQSKQKGDHGLTHDQGMVVSAQVDSALADAAPSLVYAQAVKLKDSNSNVPEVQAVAADTERPFGFIVRTYRDVNYGKGEAVNIAREGAILWMEASEAIVRGADISVDLSDSTNIARVKTADSGDWISGRAYDKAGAAGDLIRVEIQLERGLKA